MRAEAAERRSLRREALYWWKGGASREAHWPAPGLGGGASADPRARGCGSAESRPLGSVLVVSRSRGSSAGRAGDGWKAEPRPLGSVFVVGRSDGLVPPPGRREGRAPPPETGALQSRGDAAPRNVSDDTPRKPPPQAVRSGPGARPGPPPFTQPWRHVLRGRNGKPSPAPGDHQWPKGPAPPLQRGHAWGAGERPTSPFFVRSGPGSSPRHHRRESGATSLVLGGGRRAEPPCVGSSLARRPCTAPSAHQWSEGAATLPRDVGGRKAGPASFNSLLTRRPSTAPLNRPSCSWEGWASSSGPSRMRGAEPSSLTFPFGRSSPTLSAHPRWDCGGRRAGPPSFSGSFTPGPLAPHWWENEAPPLSRKARPPSLRLWARCPKFSPSWPRSEGNFPQQTSPPGLRRGEREEPPPNFLSEVAWGRGPGGLSSHQGWLRGVPSPPQPRRNTQPFPQPIQFRYPDSPLFQVLSSAPFDPYWIHSPAWDPPPATGWKAEPRFLESLLMRKRNPVPFCPHWLEEGITCTYRRDSWKPKPHSPDPSLFGKRGSALFYPYWAEVAATGPQRGDPCKPSNRGVDSLVFGNGGSAPSAPYWVEGGTTVTPLGDNWRSQPRPLDFVWFGERSPSPSAPYWLKGGVTSTPRRNGWKAEPRPLDFKRFGKQGPVSNSPHWLEGGVTAPPLRDCGRAEPRPLNAEALARYWSEGEALDQARGIGRKEPRSPNSSLLDRRNAAPLARPFPDRRPPDLGFGIFWEAEPCTVHPSALAAALGFGSSTQTLP